MHLKGIITTRRKIIFSPQAYASTNLGKVCRGKMTKMEPLKDSQVCLFKDKASKSLQWTCSH